MTIRTTNGGPYNLYDLQADEDYYCSEVSTIAFICGLDGRSIGNYEFEDIIDAIKSTFPELPHDLVNSRSIPNEVADIYKKTVFFKHAAGCYSYKNQRMLIVSIRRAWRMASLASTGQVNG